MSARTFLGFLRGERYKRGDVETIHTEAEGGNKKKPNSFPIQLTLTQLIVESPVLSGLVTPSKPAGTCDLCELTAFIFSTADVWKLDLWDSGLHCVGVHCHSQGV